MVVGNDPPEVVVERTFQEDVEKIEAIQKKGFKLRKLIRNRGDETTKLKEEYEELTDETDKTNDAIFDQNEMNRELVKEIAALDTLTAKLKEEQMEQERKREVQFAREEALKNITEDVDKKVQKLTVECKDTKQRNDNMERRKKSLEKELRSIKHPDRNKLDDDQAELERLRREREKQRNRVNAVHRKFENLI